MRLVILGMDGLDPELVLRWRFDPLLQRWYGRHFVGFLKTLYTPIIWACFLTGKNAEELGFGIEELRVKRAKDSLNPLLRPLYELRLKLIGRRPLGIRRVLIRLGLAREHTPAIMPEHLLKQTFLEQLKGEGLRVVALEVPGYNERINERFRAEATCYVFKPLKEKLAFLEECFHACMERTEQAIAVMKEEPDLLFVYYPLPDVAHHLLYRDLREIVALRAIYGKLVHMVKPLIEKAQDQEAAVLIVSDHGFDRKRYYHSDYGFWSLNVKPPFLPRRITDFHKLIKDLIRR